jgi:hypothetical protein
MANELERAISVVLEAAETGKEPPLSEAQFVRLVVEFLNSGDPRGALARLPGVRAGIFRGPPGSVVDRKTGRPAVMTDETAETFVSGRRDLDAIVRNELPGASVARLRAEARRTVLAPSYEVTSGELRVMFHHMPQGVRAAIAYGALLMWDAVRPFRKDLKRCRLPGCGRFFFASDRVGPKGGRPRYAYCCDEHMEAGQTPGAERTRKWRREKKRREQQGAESTSLGARKHK